MQSNFGMSHPARAMNYELQALRGLAIFMVIYYHMVEMIPGLKPALGIVGELLYGGQGVDLFFVVSGYVITRSMYRHVDHAGTVNIRDGLRFWVRRACRTLPPALIWLGIVLAITIYTGWYGPVANNFLHAKAAAFQYSNFFNMSCGATASCGIFSYYWSLSLEEQFYLFLPAMMLLCTRRQLAFFMLLGGIVAAVLLTKLVSLLHLNVDLSRYQPLRTDGLMFGVALALFESSKMLAAIKRFLVEHRVVTLLLCLVTHVVLWTRGSPLAVFAFGAYISAGTSAAVLVLIGISCKGCVVPNLLRKGLIFLGNISFSLYLTHIIMIYSLQNYMGMHGYTLPSGAWYLPYVMFLFLAIVVVSWLSHRFIETPFQLLGRRLSDEKLSLPADHAAEDSDDRRAARSQVEADR